ncbi:hypothetical protein IMSHALPRED_005845 [Imshaugia aleurites]|uniref:Uncharacterized protein n=1 Tax=Imshaugia aleurites TaxID=172621 RepID=A0A8H3IPX1_9LECA|nr:hypothetical protein IMSHALPRED_005845 [Imshaugia aleurites]
MRIHTITSILLAASSQSLAQTQANNDTENAANHWCGKWAGSPNPADVPTAQQLPPSDYIRRFFVEPQLQRTPFAPIVATEPKVQIPKIWGNNAFRVALLSYAVPERIYASSKSRWDDFNNALSLVWENCVKQGSGGAYLVPPSPGLTQATLVVYAYAVGSYFDFQMNYYMSAPYGINPATIQGSFEAADFNASSDVAAAVM